MRDHLFPPHVVLYNAESSMEVRLGDFQALVDCLTHNFNTYNASLATLRDCWGPCMVQFPEHDFDNFLQTLGQFLNVLDFLGRSGGSVNAWCYTLAGDIHHFLYDNVSEYSSKSLIANVPVNCEF